MLNYTLIIPTFNRPPLLKRLLTYIASKKIHFNIIVVDSSEQGLRTINRKLCEALDLRINYIEYDSNTAPVPKVLDGLKRVTTKYVSLCADDDLLFMDTIPKCLNFLETTKDYVACHGYYINIGNYGHGEYDIDLEYGSPSLDGETFEDRLFQLFDNYGAISYAIFETSIMVEYLEAALDIEPYAYIELFTGIAPLMRGKVKRLPFCYHARTRQTSVSSHDNPRWHPNLWFVDDPDGFVQEYIKYREVVKKFINERSGHKIEDLDRLLSLLHSIYFFKNFDPFHIRNVLTSDYKINQLTVRSGEKALAAFLHHVAYTAYHKLFLGKYLVRRKSMADASIIFRMPKTISKTVVSHSALIDLENYLLGHI
jgi:glycosyltransferase domain-containing protein